LSAPSVAEEKAQVKQARLGNLEVGRIGFGAMGMSGVYGGPSDDEESIRIIHRATELGVTLIDTAEIYGPYHNEEWSAAPSRVAGTG
jgi:aryl-alcohol dehydrogenase-like predicted oxidoreductase